MPSSERVESSKHAPQVGGVVVSDKKAVSIRQPKFKIAEDVAASGSRCCAAQRRPVKIFTS